MLQKLKIFYWKTRASKGENLLFFWQSLLSEVKVNLWMLLTKTDTKINHDLQGKLIVSLTSYPPRFKKLHLSIYCLLKQDMSSDLVVLWVTDEDRKLLPKKVVNLTHNERFIIKTCEDLGPGKKILPAVKAFPNDFIITADDDLYYPKEWIKELVSYWNKDNKTVMAHRVHRVTYTAENKPDLYLNWTFDISDQKILGTNFATSGAGVLYPPKSLHKKVIDKGAFLTECNKQDDIWQYWMVRLNNSYIQNTPWSFHLISWLGSEDGSLAVTNLGQGENDKCVSRMIERYDWLN